MWEEASIKCARPYQIKFCLDIIDKLKKESKIDNITFLDLRKMGCSPLVSARIIHLLKSYSSLDEYIED